VIANEFTEATGDVHLQALIELGLVLFLLTFLLNGVARLLIVLTRSAEAGRLTHEPDSMGKFVSGFMLTMTVYVRWWRSAYCFHPRLPRLSRRPVDQLGFFHEAAEAVGETGGGMANAIVGSAKLLLLASLLGAPIVSGAIYLAEFSGSKVAFVVRMLRTC